MRRLPWLRASCSRRFQGLLATALLLASASLVGVGALGLRSADAAGMPRRFHASIANDLQKVTGQIMCQCGCNLTVSACEQTMVCDISARMKKEALGLLKSGEDVSAVLASFSNDYGEQVLAAPTKKGFNLTAWIMPFAALAVGLIVISVALLRWRRHPLTVLAEEEAPDMAYLARVEEEVSRDR